MWIDVDEDLFPRRSSLVGLEFATAEEYRRCRELVKEDPERYSEFYERNRMVAIRRTDLPIVAASGLQYVERELLDMDDLSPEEARELDREAVKEGMAILVARLRGEK